MRARFELLIISCRIYRLLLYAYPTRFRRAFGTEMAQAFRDDARSTLQSSGIPGLVRLLFLTYTDLLKTAFAEHIWEIFHMPINKLQRWNGVAAAIGGPIFVASFLSPTFWRFVRLAGVPDGPFTHPVLVWIGLLLTAFGMFGLYNRLPAGTRPASTLAFAATFNAILAGLLGVLGMVMPLPEIMDVLIAVSVSLLWLGLFWMGVIANSHKVLGSMSFAPMAVVSTGAVFVWGVHYRCPR